MAPQTPISELKLARGGWRQNAPGSSRIVAVQRRTLRQQTKYRLMARPLGSGRGASDACRDTPCLSHSRSLARFLFPRRIWSQTSVCGQERTRGPTARQHPRGGARPGCRPSHRRRQNETRRPELGHGPERRGAQPEVIDAESDRLGNPRQPPASVGGTQTQGVRAVCGTYPDDRREWLRGVALGRHTRWLTTRTPRAAREPAQDESRRTRPRPSIAAPYGTIGPAIIADVKPPLPCHTRLGPLTARSRIEPVCAFASAAHARPKPPTRSALSTADSV